MAGASTGNIFLLFAANCLRQGQTVTLKTLRASPESDCCGRVSEGKTSIALEKGHPWHAAHTIPAKINTVTNRK